jgi:hypothetical protein
MFKDTYLSIQETEELQSTEHEIIAICEIITIDVSKTAYAGLNFYLSLFGKLRSAQRGDIIMTQQVPMPHANRWVLHFTH